MKKYLGLIFLILTLVSCILPLASSADDFAAGNRGLFNTIDGYVMLTTEKSTKFSDEILYKSEVSVYKNFKWGPILVQPYYYFKNEAYGGVYSSLNLTENMVGADFIAMRNELALFSIGLGYKLKTETTLPNDQLLVSRVRLDF